MLIREKVGSDSVGCVALMNLTHTIDGYPRYVPEDPVGFVCSEAEIAAWVVELDDEIVGHVALHHASGDPTLTLARARTGLPDDRLAVVSRLMVHPRARRLGVGRRLLDTAIFYADRHGRRTVLDVDQVSESAVALYEAAGWTRLGPTLLPLNGKPDLLMWVYLSPG